MILLPTPSLSILVRIPFLLSVVRNVILPLSLKNLNDIVYLYSFGKRLTLLHTAKLALKANGLQDYVDGMSELN